MAFQTSSLLRRLEIEALTTLFFFFLMYQGIPITAATRINNKNMYCIIDYSFALRVKFDRNKIIPSVMVPSNCFVCLPKLFFLAQSIVVLKESITNEESDEILSSTLIGLLCSTAKTWASNLILSILS
jgi:hypothetical protein